MLNTHIDWLDKEYVKLIFRDLLVVDRNWSQRQI